MKQMILEIDEGADFDLMPDLLKQSIKEALVEWDLDTLPSTKALNGKRLILIQSKLDKLDLESQMNEAYSYKDEQGEDAIINFNLGWSVLAVEDEQVDQSVLLPYFEDQSIIDELTQVVSLVPVADLTNKLPTYSGRKWLY